jgi:aspartate/methionine/tyrosine aminotransferase
VWAYDFVEDRTHDGRKIRMLNIVDEFTREALVIRVARRLNSADVIDVLSDLFILRGVPAHIRSDNGPEFIAKAVQSWITAVGAQTAYITTIIEDDIFADFEVETTPRLAALDGLNRVIYIGGFSKTLSASLRCGFVAVRQELIEPLIEVKLSTQSGGGPASADVIYRALTNGFYWRHTASLKARLGTAMGAAITRLKQAGLTPWIEPRGGMFIWAELPDGLHAADVARAALAEGMLLAPGDAFSITKPPSRFLRFNASQCSDPQIFPTLLRAMKKPANFKRFDVPRF